MEYKEKQVEKFRWVRFAMRICANIIILGMMAGSTFAIYAVVERSKTIENDVNADAFRRNEVPIVVSFITLVFPNFFELVSKGLERFHPRTSLRLHLGRILVLYFLNFYTLIFAIFTKMQYYIELQENIQDLPVDLISNLTETEALQLLPRGSNDPMSLRFMRDLINSLNKASTMSSGEDLATNLTNFTLSGAAIASRLPLYQLLPKQFFGNRFVPFAKGSMKQRLIEARIKSYRTAKTGVMKSTTLPSFNFTTIHPEYGTLGVAKVHAFFVNGTDVNDTEDSTFPTTVHHSTFQRNLSHMPRTSVIPLPQKLQGISSDELGNLCWETMIGQVNL
ncbi:unnamed protein product [Soboliphyme baturini]|uniref:Transmembrane protein n=1 Tax=Soboliphyme baturini TaxID=241478 RepID=A0A183J5K3_9BILA|nr:unnamed protein product [Soboliphyme baturini]